MNAVLYHQRVSLPLKKYDDMSSEGCAGHPEQNILIVLQINVLQDYSTQTD
jgi:hypothetical protein